MNEEEIQIVCDIDLPAPTRERLLSSASGTFSTYMSRLRGLELVTGRRGATRLSEELADL
jgi:hypothetical protein